MASPAYRPDVDGLRAVAVGGVVLFHTGLGVPGGYVGVDVFFVISGFLITRILLRDLAAERFTLADFWARRIRRILPAAAVVVASTIALGAWLLDPVALENVGDAASMHAVMLANHHFYDDVGYFAGSAELQPLLHLWSLAVEEQFYLFFPPLLAWLWRRHPQRIGLCLAATALGSLALCVALTAMDPDAAFFLLPARAWELLAGAVLATADGRVRLSRAAAEAMSLAGVVAIAASMAFFDGATPFPGVAALLPVAGAAAIIVAGVRPTLVGRALGLSPLTSVGRFSYSLYLWHWPLLVFAKHLVVEQTPALMLALAALSVPIGYLSWRFVEEPFRRGQLLRTPSYAFRFGVATTLAVGLTGVAVDLAEGLPGRFGPRWETQITDICWTGSRYARSDHGPTPLGTPLDAGALPDFVLWGDSHARGYAEVFDEAARRAGLSGKAYVRSAVIPIPGVWRESWSGSKQAEVRRHTERVAREVIDAGVPHVVLVARWAEYCLGRTVAEVASGKERYASLVTDDRAMASELDPDTATAAFRRRLSDLVRRAEASGSTLWLIRQAPEIDDVEFARRFFIASRFSAWNRPPQTAIDRRRHEARRSPLDAVFASIESDALRVVDPSDGFFDAAGRILASSERAHYRDDNHLTRFGARRLMGRPADELMRSIRTELAEAPRRAVRVATEVGVEETAERR